ncbi:DUF488 domain-containing protein [Bacillus safensis]|uniref:DUF488 domain-containing protein n=1 Tax=Bacillus safensis TaxID=561879 RepID=UPI00227FD54B|nr:DUF488 domain-containing protein [Bacillus safensis]MCY7674843.1 DUF488 domain-containing protein [Bacillus safensis]MCY7697350.1 DUF488 domain-containing protein [Bacillus safensis]MEC3628021.1 DUF488 domain-containing protein [Bacillus safensis]
MPNITTIGFAKKTLKNFLTLLKEANVTCLVDTRLNNTSQLSGFAKKNDLEYILEEFMGIKYLHRLDFAPTKEMLSDYKAKKISWDEYKDMYINLLKERKIEDNIEDLFEENETLCFLCSEHKHDHCHRSLLVDYIKNLRGNLNIIHL